MTSIGGVSCCAVCLDHHVEAVLDPCKHLEITLKHINNFRICLFKETNGLRYDLSSCGNASSMVRGSKKDNAVGGIKNIVEMSLQLLPRLEKACHGH